MGNGLLARLPRGRIPQVGRSDGWPPRPSASHRGGGPDRIPPTGRLTVTTWSPAAGERQPQEVPAQAATPTLTARVLVRGRAAALTTLVAPGCSATLVRWRHGVLGAGRPLGPWMRSRRVRVDPSGYARGLLPVQGHFPTALCRVPHAGRAHRFGGGRCHGGGGRGPPHPVLLPGLSGEHQPFGHADVHGILPHHGNGVFGEGGSGRGPCPRRQTSGHRRRLRWQPAGLGKEIVGRSGRGAARPRGQHGQ